MSIKQIYPSFNSTVDYHYYQQAISSFSSGVPFTCIDGDIVTIYGNYVLSTRDAGSGIKALTVCKINHVLGGLQPVFFAYDLDIGGTPDDVYSLITKGICMMGYPLISDPDAGFGGNDFWCSYLVRCTDDEISLLTLDDTRTEVVGHAHWKDVNHFSECALPNVVIRVDWGYRDRERVTFNH